MMRAVISALRRLGLRGWLIVSLPAISVGRRLRRRVLLSVALASASLQADIRRVSKNGVACPGQARQCNRRSQHKHVKQPKLWPVQRNLAGLVRYRFNLPYHALLREELFPAGAVALRSCYALYRCNPAANIT